MHKEFLMGNQAMGRAAIAAGVRFVAGYPGTPSTEVLETAARFKTDSMYVEWSANEKSAMEAAAGAAYSGARALVTMKRVGLNVASDPPMSLEYIGVKGGMVVLVADDPGPISSQTEQDTRHFGAFSKVPVFDPSDVQEAYDMMIKAFAVSEEYGTPVILRSTTRICHSYQDVEVRDADEYEDHMPEGFVRDSRRWVIFPALSNKNHAKIFKRNEELKEVFSELSWNEISKAEGRTFEDKGIIAQGISYSILMDSLEDGDRPRTMKLSTPYPFPEKKVLEFLEGLKDVLVLEELDPVIEEELLKICGKHHLDIEIKGKYSGDTDTAGEFTKDRIRSYVKRFLGLDEPSKVSRPEPPELPVRPPVLCAGCPHRASFYAVKTAMKGKKAVFCGDIGCYTLGNAMPLDMVDTCLCMGAGINIAQGIWRTEPDTKAFAFVGDSTFFASAVTGIINAKYNKADLTVVVLDNSTTAMTGHQPHPGTGRTMMGDVTEAVSIEDILKGAGVEEVRTVDPLKLDEAVSAVKELTDMQGVKAVVFRYPCIALKKPDEPYGVDQDSCIGCRRCITELGCPAISESEGIITIDEDLCTGCGLCSQICPKKAIVR
ncbi:MAG: indolepyruvate ferredoxin oxidoreductase subunit alpha [Lachnospiraceae bacterium]|nr:indolepyruvate ferredoxin oxidoreductase subunit alpha [Lachnospiraceae bacterium]